MVGIGVLRLLAELKYTDRNDGILPVIALDYRVSRRSKGMWCDGCSLIPTHNLQTKLTTQNYANLSANLSSPSPGCVIFRQDVLLPNGQPDNSLVQSNSVLFI